MADLARDLEAATVSVHLSFSRAGGVAVDDLLPLPRTVEALQHCVERLGVVQDRIEARVCIENVSRYLDPSPSAALGEAEFLAAVAERAGCGVLLDVNNLFVTSRNLGLDLERELAALPLAAVELLHVAGHEAWASGVLVDTHSGPPCPAVVALARRVLEAHPRAIPCILEWDRDVPSFATVSAALHGVRAGLEGDA